MYIIKNNSERMFIMLKKYLSLFLAVMLIGSTMPLFSLAAEQAITYIYDDFEDGTHIDAYSVWQEQLKGDCSFYVDSVAMPGNPSNKVLVFNNPSSGSEYLTNLNAQNLAVSGDLYVEFDICMNSCASTTNFAEFFIDDNGASLLRFNVSNGEAGSLQANYLRTSDKAVKQKTILTNYEFGKWYNFKFIIKTREGTYSIWLDDVPVQTDITFPIDYSSKTFTDYKLTMFRVQLARAGQILMDNIDIRTYSPAEFLSATPADALTPIHPSDKLIVKAGGFADKLELELNGASVSSDGITQSGDTFTIDPGRLNWDTDYTLTGTVSDMFGGSDDFTVSFKTKPLEGHSVDILGFTDAEGNELAALSSGIIKSQIIFESDSAGSEFTALAGLFKEDDGIIELVDIVTVSKSNASTHEVINLALTVPTECENMFIDVYMWKSLASRTLFDDEAYYGKTRLE